MINLQNNQGKTPLHYACHEGHEQVAQLLLTEGATIERSFEDKSLHLRVFCYGSLALLLLSIYKFIHVFSHFFKFVLSLIRMFKTFRKLGVTQRKLRCD